MKIMMLKCLASTLISCFNGYKNLMEMAEHIHFQLAIEEKLQNSHN